MLFMLAGIKERLIDFSNSLINNPQINIKMKQLFGCLIWCIVIMLIVAYCNRSKESNSIIVTSAKFIKEQVDAVDSVWSK